MSPPALRQVLATRYVAPLREGGSLPAVVEADDQGTYVAKFRGAGQGARALIAELIGGEIGRALGLRVPEIVLIDIDPGLARTEPDDEIRELLKRSAGRNLALDYLPGSLAFDPLSPLGIDPELAARIVWFDAFITNVDRTARNTNLLLWHRQLWLIDHGASLIFHHDLASWRSKAQGRFAAIRDHVLLPFSASVQQAAPALRAALDPPRVAAIIDLVPDEWLAAEGEPAPAEQRAIYRDYLGLRLSTAQEFEEEADRARALLA